MIFPGIIRTYDPATREYTVSIDRQGVPKARRLNAGLDKPFQTESRVICLKCSDMSWLILGEVDMPSPIEDQPESPSVDDAAAALVNELNALNSGEREGAKGSFRKPNDNIHFIGDVSLENREPKANSRSRIKIFSFGSILTQASNLCFQLLDRKENRILTQARNILTRCIGYVQSIRFNQNTRLVTQSETLKASPLEATPKTDFQRIAGFVPKGLRNAKKPEELMIFPKVERGVREIMGNHRVEEFDNLTHTHRARQDTITYDTTGKEATRNTEMYQVTGRIAGEGAGNASFGSRTTYRDWLVIQVDNEGQSVLINDLKNNQKIEMNPGGILVKANNINIESKVTKITASESVVIDTPGFFVNNLQTMFMRSKLGKNWLAVDSGGDNYFDLSEYAGIWLNNYTEEADKIPVDDPYITANSLMSNILGMISSRKGAFWKSRRDRWRNLSSLFANSPLSSLASATSMLPSLSTLAGGLSGSLGGLTSGLSGSLGGLTSGLGGLTGGLTGGLGGLTGGLGGLTGGLGGLTGGITEQFNSITKSMPDVQNQIAGQGEALKNQITTQVEELNLQTQTKIGPGTDLTSQVSNLTNNLPDIQGQLSSQLPSIPGLPF